MDGAHRVLPESKLRFYIMATLSRKKSKQLSVLLSCLKSASRTQSAAKAVWLSDIDNMNSKDLWLQACEQARGYEQEILDLMGAQS